MSIVKQSIPSFRSALLGAAAVAAALLAGPAGALAWEPTKSVEFIVPAGTGGGADQMARMIQGIIQKNNLMSQPMVVINKAGGARAPRPEKQTAQIPPPPYLVCRLLL